jgi:hypothetical protein
MKRIYVVSRCDHPSVGTKSWPKFAVVAGFTSRATLASQLSNRKERWDVSETIPCFETPDELKRALDEINTSEQEQVFKKATANLTPKEIELLGQHFFESFRREIDES